MGMDVTLKLGVAMVDITPKKPLPLAGFASRKGNYSAVSKPISMRIFLFEQDTQSGEKARALFVSADLIWWGQERIADLKRALSSRFAIAESSIILHATHSHSGPQTSSRFTPSLGMADLEYVDFLETQLFAGVHEAEGNLERVVVRKGNGTCDIGINRRKMVDGQLMMLPNPDGPNDPEVTVISFLKENGQPKGMFVHYTCHPTTTADNVVSPEFSGVAVSRIEKTFGDGLVVGYLQGCCGNVRPGLIQNDTFQKGSQKEVQRLGDRLADEILAILRAPMSYVSPALLQSRSVGVPLLFKSLPNKAELKQTREKPGIWGEWSQLLLDNPSRLQRTIPLHITLLQLADGVSLLAMNGEVVVEYGLYAKELFNGQVLPLGYSNGMIGYVPTAQHLSEGGYEAKGSVMYFGLPSAFSDEVESSIREAIKGLKDAIKSCNLT